MAYCGFKLIADDSWLLQSQLYVKRVKHGRGKVLGGSSAINVLALVYPSRSGIDN